MRLIKVAAGTLNQIPLDWEGNRRRMLAAIQAARADRVSVLCLPELCITGYGCEDAFLSPGTQNQALKVLQQILPETRGMIVSAGLPLFHNKANYNVCALLADGRLAGFVAKRALAGDGIHYEPRWFKPWPRGVRSTVEVLGIECPIGDVHFDCGGVKIGFEICEDAWIALRPGADLSLDAVDIILNPSASHFAFGKRAIRERLVLEGSRAFGVSYVYANLSGNEAGRAIYEGDAMIATGGAMVARGRRFSFAEYSVLSALIDVDLTRTRHSWLSSYEPALVSEEKARVRVAFGFPEALPEPPDAARELGEGRAWERLSECKHEEFTRAVSLALFDYLRKSRSRGFVVSLSGGADSSAVACLVATMVGLGVAELGIDGFARALSHVPELGRAKSVKELTFELLTTVYQSTENSSETTRNAARGVAEAIGARHLELDVDGIVKSYVGLIERALSRKLSWEQDDIALQNIQARARSPSVWLLANLSGALLLSTSNRSEAAVGYATMDGDTSGGLSPIAGIDKAFLSTWLRFMQERGPHGLSALPALEAVTRQVPTAELRPGSAGQTDESDLMPYPLLDAIERAAIRDKRSPVDVYRLTRAAFPEYSKAELGQWIERFFRLWSRNQWKRERYAPSFHVDDANLDPKTWCRFPILSGGFERELAELAAVIEQDS